MPKVLARIGGDKYKTSIQARTHTILADEPVELGGEDQGPAPAELLSASLASCTAITLKMYIARKQWAVEHVEVEVDYNTDNTLNITKFTRKIRVDATLEQKQLESLMKIANTCPIHKILDRQIQIETHLKLHESRTV